MRAITLYPEWAWAICRLGKNIENRKRRTLMPVGEPLAIHSGVSFGGAGHASITEAFLQVQMMAVRAGWRVGVKRVDNTVQAYSVQKAKNFTDRIFHIPTGAVVAVAKFGGLLTPREDPIDKEKRPWWAGDQYGYILEDVQVLPEPVQVRGQQGVWNLKAPALQEVLSQISIG